LEDFGCYVIWGVAETFGPDLYAGQIHGVWIGGLPVFYLSAIPGIIMIIISLWYSRKIPKTLS